MSDYDLVGGDEPGCNFNSILHMTALQYRDIIHISYHNQVPDMYTLIPISSTHLCYTFCFFFHCQITLKNFSAYSRVCLLRLDKHNHVV